jgi:hypothetical protein
VNPAPALRTAATSKAAALLFALGVWLGALGSSAWLVRRFASADAAPARAAAERSPSAAAAACVEPQGWARARRPPVTRHEDSAHQAERLLATEDTASP